MNWLAFDTEDDSVELLASGRSGFDKRVTQIAALMSDGRGEYYSQGDVVGFLDWLQELGQQYGMIIAYAHNLAYDLGNLFGRDKLDAFDSVDVGGRMIRATWGKVQFRDSYNLWPMALRKVGEAFGMQKLQSADLAALHGNREYVWRDVEITRRAIDHAWSFAAKIGLDYCPATLGGLAVAYWRAIGGQNVGETSELAREAYYGGRVELFKTCSETPNVANTDLNSLYPFAMLREFPAALEDWNKELPPWGVVRAKVKVPRDSWYGFLPLRGMEGGIAYPVGTFIGTWPVPELVRMEAHGGRVLQVLEARGSNECMRPYADFVESIYRLRLASKSEAEKTFWKLLMNSFSGRLGLTGTVGRGVIRDKDNESQGTPYGKRVHVEYQMPLPEETNWGHIAYVTSYARCELMGYFDKVGPERMIYCDTDSCIFDCPDKVLPFATGKELGQMKLEVGPRPDGFWDFCETFAPKQYKLENNTGVQRWKAKGVPRRLAAKFITRGKAEYDMPYRFREAITFYDPVDKQGRRRPANSRMLSVWRRVVKVNRADYDRKKLQGCRYFPCAVSELSAHFQQSARGGRAPAE